MEKIVLKGFIKSKDYVIETERLQDFELPPVNPEDFRKGREVLVKCSIVDAGVGQPCLANAEWHNIVAILLQEAKQGEAMGESVIESANKSSQQIDILLEKTKADLELSQHLYRSETQRLQAEIENLKFKARVKHEEPIWERLKLFHSNLADIEGKHNDLTEIVKNLFNQVKKLGEK